MKTWIYRILVLILILVTLSGCVGESSRGSEKPPLKVEWSLWYGDYTLLIAKELGFFEKHGVAVEPIQYEVLSAAVPDLAGHKIDGGLFTISDLLNVSRVTDVSTVIVYDSGGSQMFVANANINSVHDLKGKRIGVQTGSPGEMFVLEMLRSAGISPKDVTIVDIDVEQVPEKLSSEIQAGYTWDPFLTQALEKGNKILYTSGNSSIAPDVIMFRRDVLDSRPEDIRAFVSAWFEALDYRLAHQKECDELIARLTGQPLEDLAPGDDIVFSLRDNLAFFSDNQAQSLSSIYYITDININFLVSAGLITRKPDLNKLLDPTFLVH